MEEKNNPEELGDELAPLGDGFDVDSIDDLELTPIDDGGLDELDLGDESIEMDFASSDLLEPDDDFELGAQASSSDLDMNLDMDVPDLEPQSSESPILTDDAGIDESGIKIIDDPVDQEEGLGGEIPEDDSEDIALSTNELDNILSTTDDSFYEEMPEGDMVPPGVDAEDMAIDLEATPAIGIEGDLDPINPESSQVEEGLSLDSDTEDDIIALSSDELDNILEDVEESDGVDFASPEEDFPELEMGTEDLSLDESSQIPEMDLGASGSDDEDISLSDDELSQVILDTKEETVGHAIDSQDESIPENPVLTSLEMDDEEPIALTAEELGNIVSEVDMEDSLGVVSEDDGDLDLMSGDLEEDIALSGAELDNILEDVDEAPVASDELNDNTINLDEYSDEAEVSEEISSPSTEEAMEAEPEVVPSTTAVADNIAEAEGVDKADMRKMVSYLDGLFDQLPEDTIREFSKSEYFDLYKKIMTDLEL